MAGTSVRRQVSMNALESSNQPPLSKSTAKKKDVSSKSIGYTPATKRCPASSHPERCHRITSSVTGRKRRFGHSAHLMRGFSQMPRTHSLAHAGAYPDLPVFRLSNRRAYTSSRPRKRDRKRAILVWEEDAWLTGSGLKTIGRSREGDIKRTAHCSH